MPSDIARFIDHTNLKPAATAEDIVRLCGEAVRYRFASVCVNPTHVPLARRQLAGSGVAVCTVVGFPLGANVPETKAFEAAKAVADGATEIDMVVNVGAIVGRDFDLARRDIQAVRAATPGRILKVIIETGLLNDEQKAQACMLASEEGADFVKTCTGVNPGQATVEDIVLMKRNVSPKVRIKASAGIRTLAAARAMIEAGATRLGTSAGVAICDEEAGKAPDTVSKGY